MAVRSNDELVSNLPVFEARRSKDFPSWLIVYCPREDCKQEFLVRMSAWYGKLKVRDTVIVGRPCPYCFKAGRLPARSRIR